MTKDQLYHELKYVSATKASRSIFSDLVIDTPELFLPLLEILFMVNDKRSVKAAWIVEFVCKRDIRLLFPHMDYFTGNISKLHLGSAVRPCAKILEIIIELYYEKQHPELKQLINENHKTQIAETCFDWLIGDEKVAVKAYSMTILFYLGTEFHWIHPELKQVIDRNYFTESAGFKAKSRHILQKIQK